MRARWVFPAAPVVVLIAGAIVASRGALQTTDGGWASRAAGPGGAPGWAAPCRERPPRADRELLRACARVEGRVLKVSADASGWPRQTHVAMVADFHLVIVKLPPGQRAPAVGSTTVAVGPLVRARNGFREVDAVRAAST